MRRAIAFLLLLSIVLSGGIVTACAAHIVNGDVNGNGEPDVMDVTLIQRYLADMIQLTEEQQKAGMVENGEVLTIIDATLLQRRLAGMIDRFPVETKPEPTEVNKEMQMMINDTPVAVKWEDNEAVASLAKAVGTKQLTIQMSMYGGFEQVGSLGMSLPRNDTRITTEPGDVILYSGNQMVVFYGSNTWAYTRLGHITDKTESELAELLSNGDVTITLTEGKL